MPSINDMPELLTVEEAAAALRISRSAAYERTMRYRATPATGIPVIRLGSRLRVPKHSIVMMLDAVHVMSQGLPKPEDNDQNLIWTCWATRFARLTIQALRDVAVQVLLTLSTTTTTRRQANWHESSSDGVPGTGFEPVHTEVSRGLSPLRLPVPPPGLEASR